ncbi:MAG: hypothetical protein NTV58_12000 [Deltaproteobacteria bacterium]|nr:hypothetical protein [Deltaproteobacteria bacterium]
MEEKKSTGKTAATGSRKKAKECRGLELPVAYRVSDQDMAVIDALVSVIVTAAVKASIAAAIAEAPGVGCLVKTCLQMLENSNGAATQDGTHPAGQNSNAIMQLMSKVISTFQRGKA